MDKADVSTRKRQTHTSWTMLVLPKHQYLALFGDPVAERIIADPCGVVIGHDPAIRQTYCFVRNLPKGSSRRQRVSCNVCHGSSVMPRVPGRARLYAIPE